MNEIVSFGNGEVLRRKNMNQIDKNVFISIISVDVFRTSSAIFKVK